jgi:hypothetical protein
VTAPDGGGRRPSAERPLGEIVADVSQKASLLVREEIALAKAEVSDKLGKLGKGAAVAGAGAVFLVFGLIYALFGLAFLINDALGQDHNIWLGFFIVTALLLVLGGIAIALAIRFFKRGAPPTPDLAIEEARRTRADLEEARR